MLGLTDDLYRKFSILIKEKVGIEYGEKQRNVLNNRLMSLLAANQLTNFGDYYHLLLEDVSGFAMSEFIAKITTNHTYFYRENSHFEYLESSVFPEQEKKLRNGALKELRYWVAASSTGEEPYTLAMMLNSHFHKKSICEASVLATDISRSVVEKASMGRYKKIDLEKLPALYFEQNFTQIDDNTYEANSDIKRMVTFRVLNLIRDVFPFQSKFDVIFIRNVMIYFDEDTRSKLISQLHELLQPGGYFFIGQTESIPIKNMYFEQVFPSVFRKIN